MDGNIGRARSVVQARKRGKEALGDTDTMRGVFLRLASTFPLKPGQWDRHKALRGGLVAALFICSLLATAKWYDWGRGGSPLYVPILWTLATALIILAAPRKRILVGGCLLVYVFYSAKALVLRQEPHAALVTAIIAIVFFFILIISTPSGRH